MWFALQMSCDRAASRIESPESLILKTTTLRRHLLDFCALLAIVVVGAPLFAQDPSVANPAPAPAAVPTEAPAADPAPTPATPPAPAEPEKDDTAELRRLAFTDLSKVDADYHDQGEYVGEIPLDGRPCPIGLQVVALGKGEFNALLYRGGLPGNGFDGSARLKLSGSRTGDQVILRNDSLVIYLQTGFAAVVKTTSGERLGFLQPIKRVSQTMGEKPPANAIVLFDGNGTDQWANAKVTSDGLLEVGCETKNVYQNFTLHGEFRTPYMPYARGQDRGNSGFYLQRRYEVQVLDSFGLEVQFNECASLYKFKAPDLNMSFPPLRWQTYDITFNAPQFDVCGRRICKGRITVRHNGIVVQNQVELENKTGGGRPEGPNPLPILLQDHHNPVNYRNLWLVDHGTSNCYLPGWSVGSAPTCCEVPCRLELRQRHHWRR